MMVGLRFNIIMTIQKYISIQLILKNVLLKLTVLDVNPKLSCDDIVVKC